MESFLEHLYSSFIVEQRYMLILQGLFNTLIVTLGALVFGFVLGTVIALIRSSHHFSKRFRILNICATCFVYILRGTPVLVQLLIMKNVIKNTANTPKIMPTISHTLAGSFFLISVKSSLVVYIINSSSKILFS